MNTQRDVDDLAAQEAALVRREASRALRGLTPDLIEKYTELLSDDARRKFYQTHFKNLQVGGLLQVCFESGKAISMRARREMAALQLRPVRGMRRFVYSADPP
jgi:hypothetical protein